MSAGSLASCADGGDGNDSMTETSKAVDKGSHALKTAVRMARGSLERVTCGGKVMFRDLVIFSVMAASLKRGLSEDQISLTVLTCARE